jgi:hypothetical protein
MFIYRKEVVVPITNSSDFTIELTNFPDVHHPNLMIAIEHFNYKCFSEFQTLLRPPSWRGSTDPHVLFGDLYVKANNDMIFKTLLPQYPFEGSVDSISITYDEKITLNQIGVPISVPQNRMVNFKLGFGTTHTNTLVASDHTLPDLGISYEYMVSSGYIPEHGSRYRQPINVQNCVISFTVVIYSSS